MSNRSYSLTLKIDTGSVRKLYAVRPIPTAQLDRPFIAGVRLQVLGEAGPTYSVCLPLAGPPVCSCPSWNDGDNHGKPECKHSLACVAAGLLPAALAELAHARTALLDAAEGEAAALRLALQRAEEEAKQIEQSLLAREAELHVLKQQSAVAKKPRRRSRRQAA
jgi:hypothetical protein